MLESQTLVKLVQVECKLTQTEKLLAYTMQ